MKETNIIFQNEEELNLEEKEETEDEKIIEAKNFLSNIEDELSEDVRVQVKSGLQDFTFLLSDLELDPRLASLWRLIYSNAMTDRKNAFALWLDLYVKTYNNEDKHFQHGQTLHKYMDIMTKSNQQLLKLAELVDKAREQKEKIDSENLINNFFDPKKEDSSTIKKKK
jgi:hypothetical protein